MASPRQSVIQDLTYRAPLPPEHEPLGPTSTYFGENTLGVHHMRDKLPQDVYQSLVEAVRLGKMMEASIAPVVAQVMKDWAISKGVTHFTHWFQPQTGLTAEKHDAFLSFDDDGQPFENFTAEQLIQSEPDASSFPSGGLRATWEARGYTAWNPASPIFIVESAGARTLCIPSVFIGYNGEALDEMAPLLRSCDVLSEKAIGLLELLGDKGVHRIYITMGAEQEFFLVDRTLFAMRPDLVMGGRTLIGAPPPRGQQLEDHYFGGIPERVQACISEVEYELYRLGIPIITRHNEVAPCQFEMAPRFEETDIAVDHNQLVMATLRRVALRHGFQALLTEKPFAGINGSGKHCNWSLAVRAETPELDGFNLLKPGSTPHQNLRFLLFLAAVLKGVHKHAGLLRAGIASAGNEHRLGANEAPPAIISVFMGEMLTRVIDEIIAGIPKGSAAQQMMKLRVGRLPEIEQDNTDRNRTSPFAFTGSKFEFRAVGSSASIAFPIVLLNAAVAEALEELTVALKAELEASGASVNGSANSSANGGNGTSRIDEAVLKVVRQAFAESDPIRFEGNNYLDAWIKEAENRGLPNLPLTPDALDQLMTPSSQRLLQELGIFTDEELESRYHVRTERYVKDILIELQMLHEMVDTMVLPAGYAYSGSLANAAAAAKQAGIAVIPHIDAANDVGAVMQLLRAKQKELTSVIDHANALHETPSEQAKYLSTTGKQCMEEVRALSDKLELTVGDEFWPLPKYRELLFPV